MGLLFGATALDGGWKPAALEPARTEFAMHGLRPLAEVRGPGLYGAVLEDGYPGHHRLVRRGEATLLLSGDLYAGQRPRSAESLLRDLLTRGTAALADTSGIFAGALFDQGRGELLLFNDPFGLHPLLTTHYRGQLLFCSEAEPLIRLWGSQATIDVQAVGELFALGAILGERTLVQQVENLPPGVSLRYRSGSIEQRRHGPELAVDHGLTAAGAAEELSALLRQAVQRQVQRPQDIVLRLSGGCDSRLILASMTASQRRAVRVTTSRNPCLPREQDQDVLLARMLTKRIGMRHRVIRETFHSQPFDPYFFFHRRKAQAGQRRRLITGHFGGELYGGPWHGGAFRRLLVEPDASSVTQALDRCLTRSARQGVADPHAALRATVAAAPVERRRLAAFLQLYTRSFFTGFHGGTRSGRWYQPHWFFVNHELSLPFLDSDCLRWLLQVPAELHDELYLHLCACHLGELAAVPTNSRQIQRDAGQLSGLSLATTGGEPLGPAGPDYGAAFARFARQSPLFDQHIAAPDHFRSLQQRFGAAIERSPEASRFVDVSAWLSYHLGERNLLPRACLELSRRTPLVPARIRRKLLEWTLPRVDRVLRYGKTPGN